MTMAFMRALALQSVTDPAAAARVLLGLRLPRSVLWQGLVLMAVLQAVIYALSDLAFAEPNPMRLLFGGPLQFFMIALLGMVLFVYVLRMAGRLFGGQGELDDVLAVMVWLNALRAAAQVAMLVLSLTVPMVAMVLMLVVTFFGLYISMHFINEALRLNSLLRSFFVLLVASLAIGIALSILLSLVGTPMPGANGHV
ncbi:YIP1 family protein [Seohaeicola nanhaiensis]|uniref:YIP1 family protein n=1 Tax=Seohaeicola nanhaiensis TaxID=1387282 RepID=A0ABV9KEY2_9RHOB